MKNKIINILKLFFCLLCFFSVSSICGFILKIFNFDITTLSSKGMVYYQIVLSLIIFIISFIIYNKNIKEDYKAFMNNIGSNIKNIIKLFLIFMIVKYIVSFITIMIITLLGFDTTSITSVNQELVESLIQSSPLLMAISTALLAPFYEEVIFRLGFKNVLNRGLLFIIISGFIFGVLHVFPLSDGIPVLLGIIQSISYVTMGIFLAYSYNKSNNIFISIGIHFFNNLISVLTMINMM